MLYVILKLVLNKNLVSGYRRKLYFLIRQFGGVISSKVSHVCYIMVYGRNYLRRQLYPIHLTRNDIVVASE